MHRIGLVLASLLATATLAGCGSDDFNPDVVAQAADKTAEAGGAKVAFTVDVQGQKLQGSGFMDTKGRKARMRFAMPQLGGEMGMVMIRRTVYMQLPEKLRKQVPGGKAWIKLDLDRFAQKKGIDLGSLQSTAGSNPSTQLDQLRGAGDVKRVGSEQVRGTSTTHYKATIDLRKAAQKAPAAQRDAARRSVENIIKLTGQSTMPMDVWLDDAGRMRRMKFAQKVNAQSFTTTMELYDFGTREALKAPPDSETTDLTDLAAKG